MPTPPDKSWNRHIPDGHWDYIVIGSGMGGMTTAAMLAKLGKRVLVLEQHYVPGGFTHTFKRKKWVWDVGVHAVGEVTRHSMTGRLLDAVTDSKLKWASLGEVYDEFYYPDDFRIDFPDSPKKFRQNLIDAFPDEVDAIDAYLALVREVASAMKGYYLARTTPKGIASKAADLFLSRKATRFFSETTKDVVDRLTDNPRLRCVFTAQWGYYGSPPSRSSFAIQALVVKHFMHGGYYPKGGSQEIARCLLRTVADAGGWTAINADVEEILVEDNRATGVRLKGGRIVHAGRVVSAAGVVSTVQRLLPAKHRNQAWASNVKKLPPASAHVCLYLGLRGDIREDSCGSANKWFYEVWSSEQETWDISDPDNLPDAPVLYSSFPSLKDPDHDPGPEQLHTGEVVTFVPWESFAQWKDERWHKRGQDYETLKRKLHDHMLEQFLRHVPGLRDKIAYSELSTPVSTDHFVRPMQGSIYGIEPTPERFANPDLRPRSPIKDLFFAGSEVASVGVIGAMMGGVLAATSAEPVGCAKFLRNI